MAAWMRADTGVGPAMASGSHTNSGSWADLPQAPTNSSRAMAVAVTGAMLVGPLEDHVSRVVERAERWRR